MTEYAKLIIVSTVYELYQLYPNFSNTHSFHAEPFDSVLANLVRRSSRSYQGRFNLHSRTAAFPTSPKAAFHCVCFHCRCCPSVCLSVCRQHRSSDA